MGYKRYEKYKVSGVEWIGEIPEHWEVSKLKHILKELVSGGTPSSADEENWTEDEDGINWVSIGDMSNMDYVYKTAKKITLKGLKEKNLKILKSGTLIYSIYATLGKVAELKIDAATNQAILGLILKEGQVNKQFIKRYLESLEPYILYLSSSNTQNNLNAEKVKNIDLVLPKNNEQTAIANFLDQKTAEIDSLIADKEKLIQLLQEKRQAIITEAVTKGLDSNVPMKNSGVEWIGEIPEHWGITKIKHICSESAVYGLNESSDNYEDEGIRLIRTTDIDEYGNLNEKINGVFISEEKARGYVLKTGDILLSRSGSIGLSLYFDEKKYGKCTYASYLVKFRTDKFNCPRYLFYFTKSSSFYHQIQLDAISSTISNFNGQKYANMKLPLPSYHEQKAIANFLDQKTAEIDSLISDIQNQIAKLKEYRQSLIYEAVTGKIDVRDFTSNTEGVVLDAKNTN